VEADTTLVRANGIVVLDTVAHVGLDVTIVVHPSDTELINTIRNAEALDEVDLVELRMLVVLLLDGAEDLFYCLMILWLVRESLLQILKNFLCVHD
jgi:hypothetical protein